MHKRQRSLARAIYIAADVHREQYDKGGLPYILHCIRVMENVRNDHEKLVAVLHDTIEDVRPNPDEPLSKAITGVENTIEAEFGGEVLNCVSNLSHSDDEDYLEEYIPRMYTCSTCKSVKMADLEDNLNPLRQPTLRDKDLQRLQKYHMAYRLLRGGPGYG